MGQAGEGDRAIEFELDDRQAGLQGGVDSAWRQAGNACGTLGQSGGRHRHQPPQQVPAPGGGAGWFAGERGDGPVEILASRERRAAPAKPGDQWNRNQIGWPVTGKSDVGVMMRSVGRKTPDQLSIGRSDTEIAG